MKRTADRRVLVEEELSLKPGPCQPYQGRSPKNHGCARARPKSQGWAHLQFSHHVVPKRTRGLPSLRVTELGQQCQVESRSFLLHADLGSCSTVQSNWALMPWHLGKLSNTSGRLYPATPAGPFALCWAPGPIHKEHGNAAPTRRQVALARFPSTFHQICALFFKEHFFSLSFQSLDPR